MVNQQIEKFENLMKKQKLLEEKKIRLEEQYKNKKEALLELIEEIKKAGYNPKELSTKIQEKENELIEQIKNFEKELEEVSSKISEIES
jgi:mannitol/fructose-specific phosphotransferase system IIA component (Ntr-type)